MVIIEIIRIWLNRRYNKLLDEFIEYVNNRNYQVPKSILFAPLEQAKLSRESLARHAKEKALLIDYSGMSSEPEGKKKKRGITENTDDFDEVNIYLIKLCILNTIIFYFQGLWK